mgnify:CR=1 FL=1
MRKKERYEKVIAWFQENVPVAETELHYNNPYELLIAVILSAQCTDKRVNIITPPLYRDFPTPEALAATTPEVVFEYIRSVSYPNNKAKHLVGMAKMLVNDFNSQVPDNMEDLKRRLGRIIVAYSFDGNPITADDLHATGSMAALLKDAIKPNLIQTLEHNPAIVHGGPFANIAHGCNSVRATKTALKLGDIAITEAGFGADLGAEKFFDIKCRKAGLKPDAVVLVATIRALKYNGGVPKADLAKEDLESLKRGIVNLEKHIENLQKFGVPVVVTLNSFVTDTKEEIAFVENFCKERNCEFALSEVWEKGGEGGIELAKKVLDTLEHKEAHFKPLYEDEMSLMDKIKTIATEVYGADDVTYSKAALKELKHIEEMGMGNFPVCMAKTQYSLSDDASKLGRPTGFTVNVREVYVSAGAGFVVAITGSIMTMPGLPKVPAANNIDVTNDGVITGLF